MVATISAYPFESTILEDFSALGTEKEACFHACPQHYFQRFQVPAVLLWHTVEVPRGVSMSQWKIKTQQWSSRSLIWIARESSKISKGCGTFQMWWALNPFLRQCDISATFGHIFVSWPPELCFGPYKARRNWVYVLRTRVFGVKTSHDILVPAW